MTSLNSCLPDIVFSQLHILQPKGDCSGYIGATCLETQTPGTGQHWSGMYQYGPKEEELLPFVTVESWVPLTSKKKVTSMRSLPSRSLTVRESLAGRRNNSVTVGGSHRKHQYQTLWNWFPDFNQIRNGILCNSSSHAQCCEWLLLTTVNLKLYMN